MPLEDFYRRRPQHRPSTPVEGPARGAREFSRQQEIESPLGDVSAEQFRDVEVNPDLSRRVGQAYMNMPDYDPAAEPSFRSFREETGRQFDFMTKPTSKGGLGIDVETSMENPYETPGEMRADVERGRMKVLDTAATGEHPYLSRDDNNMFRAVHDVFGHAATGRGFDRHGEEAAWMHHSQMFSPSARPAMTTETRGQNSAMNFSLGGTDFPSQKVGTLPPELQDPTQNLPRSMSRGRRLDRSNFGEQFTLG